MTFYYFIPLYFNLFFFFISSPYFCLSYHFSCFVIWTLVCDFFFVCWFVAFIFYLPSVFFCLFSYLCLSINQLLYIYFFVIFFVLLYNLKNINIVYIYLNNYLYFYFLISLCTSLLLLAVFYSCLYIDLFVALLSMKSLFFYVLFYLRSYI